MNGLTAWFPGSDSPSIPVILCAPHGGSLRPAHIPERTSGCVCPDAWSLELAEDIRAEFAQQIEASPHLVACHLHRSKLDANRARAHASNGDQSALEVWDCYHNWIREAVHEILETHRFALLLDIHGQEHRKQATELGYGFSAADLLLEDDALDNLASAANSLRALIQQDEAATCSRLVRGPCSLGTLMEQQGLDATPSQSAPQPVPADALRATLTYALRRERSQELDVGLRRLLIRHGYADEGNVNTIAESFRPYIDLKELTFCADDLLTIADESSDDRALRLADVPTEGVYFGGSYTIQCCGQMPGVVAIQVETPCCARETTESRQVFSHGFVKAVLEWLRIHYQWE